MLLFFTYLNRRRTNPYRIYFGQVIVVIVKTRTSVHGCEVLDKYEKNYKQIYRQKRKKICNMTLKTFIA